jgi:hypothetical protein
MNGSQKTSMAKNIITINVLYVNVISAVVSFQYNLIGLIRAGDFVVMNASLTITVNETGRMWALNMNATGAAIRWSFYHITSSITTIIFAMIHAKAHIIQKTTEVKNTIYGSLTVGVITGKAGTKTNAKVFENATVANVNPVEKHNKRKSKIIAQNYQSIISGENTKRMISTEWII